jgi:hypothetical protein
MLTPIVTEIPRVLEPVVRDSFIAARNADNVVALVPRASRDRSLPVVPARAA